MAKPTTVVRQDFFLLGRVKRSWAAATGYMNGMGAPEEEKQRPPFLRKAKTRSGSRAKQLWVPKREREVPFLQEDKRGLWSNPPWVLRRKRKQFQFLSEEKEQDSTSGFISWTEIGRDFSRKKTSKSKEEGSFSRNKDVKDTETRISVQTALGHRPSCRLPRL